MKRKLIKTHKVLRSVAVASREVKWNEPPDARLLGDMIKASAAELGSDNDEIDKVFIQKI